MVVASPTPVYNDSVRELGVPVIDISSQRPIVSELIVKACEETGFFLVINHGVPDAVIAQMENKASEFFSLPPIEKQRSGPASPLGYGSKTIGRKGDTGEVEYLLLHTNPTCISQRAKTISRKEPDRFSCVVNEYVESLKELACEILDLVGEGLGLEDSKIFSRLVRDSQNDSLLRMNSYPPYNGARDNNNNSKDYRTSKEERGRVGFGEHTDPQILTLLRSGDVPGLQVLSPLNGGVWVPIPADPTAFCVNVGDLLQVMTNGRLVSVRHRAMVNSYKSRLSLAYFGAPPLNAQITPIQEIITPQSPCRYRSFTWAEYKKAMYTLRLGYNRLELFRTGLEDSDANLTKR